MKHKLAYIEAKALRYWAKIDDLFPILQKWWYLKYVFDVSVRLTEYSVTVRGGSGSSEVVRPGSGWDHVKWWVWLGVALMS